MNYNEAQNLTFITESIADKFISNIDEIIGALIRAKAAAEDMKAESYYIRSVVGQNKDVNNAMCSQLQGKHEETLATISQIKYLVEEVL